MSKEKIMEEFEKMMIITSRIPDSERVFGFDMKSNQPLKNWLSNALDQVRLETIKEVEEVIDKITPAYEGEALDTNNNRRWYEQGFGEVINQIKSSLNKLK